MALLVVDGRRDLYVAVVYQDPAEGATKEESSQPDEPEAEFSINLPDFMITLYLVSVVTVFLVLSLETQRRNLS